MFGLIWSDSEGAEMVVFNSSNERGGMVVSLIRRESV